LIVTDVTFPPVTIAVPVALPGGNSTPKFEKYPDPDVMMVTEFTLPEPMIE
jgi:hypothetical protein